MIEPKRVEWRIRNHFQSGSEYATEIRRYGGSDPCVVDDTSHGKKPCDFGSRAMARHAAALAGEGWHPVRVKVYRVKIIKRRVRG